MTRWTVRCTCTALGLALAGCATTDTGERDTPKPVEVRFHLAAGEVQEDWNATQDEHGQPLFVSPQAFLTAADVRLASTVLSAKRALVLLELTPEGQAVLAEVTAESPGARLAVFVEGELVMSPFIRRPLREGKVYLDGGFGRARAEDLVARLNANRTLGWEEEAPR